MKKQLIVFMLILGLVVACKKEKDPEPTPDHPKPTITVLKVEGSNGVANKVMAGTEVEIDFEFKGKNLKEAKFDIHSNFDGHSHARLSGYVEFDWDSIMLLDGKDLVEGHIHLDIPVNATPGKYDLGVRITDNEGNNSEFKYVQFEILSAENAPEIELVVPTSASEEIEVEAGHSFQLHFIAKALAGSTLSKVEVEIKEEHDDHHGHSHRVASGDDHIWDWHKDDFTTETSYTFEQNILIPENTEEGHYELIITVIDSEGRVSKLEIEVHVEEHHEH